MNWITLNLCALALITGRALLALDGSPVEESVVAKEKASIYIYVAGGDKKIHKKGEGVIVTDQELVHAFEHSVSSVQPSGDRIISVAPGSWWLIHVGADGIPTGAYWTTSDFLPTPTVLPYRVVMKGEEFIIGEPIFTGRKSALFLRELRGETWKRIMAGVKK